MTCCERLVRQSSVEVGGRAIAIRGCSQACEAESCQAKRYESIKGEDASMQSQRQTNQQRCPQNRIPHKSYMMRAVGKTTRAVLKKAAVKQPYHSLSVDGGKYQKAINVRDQAQP